MLSEDELEEGLSRLWSLIEGQGTGVNRAERSTWTNDRWCPRTAGDPTKIAGSGSGAGGYGALQSDAAWYVRGRPGLKRMWASIYGTNDLIVSWDGFNVVRPWKHDPTWRVTAQGPHIDGVRQMQTPDGRRPDGGDFDPSTRYYAQGVVNLVRSSPDAGGNVIVSGSHKHYATLNREFFSKSGNQRITPEIVAAYPEIFVGNVIIAHVEPGDVVLWDDRSIHCNHPGVTGTIPARDGLLRAAMYCTMAPAATAVAEVVKSRKQCIAEGWGSGSGGWCAHRVVTPSTGPGSGVEYSQSDERFQEAARAVLGPNERALVAGSR